MCAPSQSSEGGKTERALGIVAGDGRRLTNDATNPG